MVMELIKTSHMATQVFSVWLPSVVGVAFDVCNLLPMDGILVVVAQIPTTHVPLVCDCTDMLHVLHVRTLHMTTQVFSVWLPSVVGVAFDVWNSFPMDTTYVLIAPNGSDYNYH